MNCRIIHPFTVKTARGQMEIQAGQLINIPDDRALILIQAGKVQLLDPEQQYAFQERAGIMGHDGGLSREQADQYSWCRDICMLSPGQRAQCEVVKPCPKYIPAMNFHGAYK